MGDSPEQPKRRGPQRGPSSIYLSTERRRQGLTQAAVGAAVGVPQWRISRLEHRGDAARPTSAERDGIAALLQIDPLLLRFGKNPRSVAATRSAKRRSATPDEPDEPDEVQP